MSSKEPRAAGAHRSAALLPMTLTSLLVLAIAAAVVLLGAQDPFPSWAAAGRAKELPEEVSLGPVPAPGKPEDVANMETNPVGAADEAAARTGEYPVTPESLITPVEEWVSEQVSAFEAEPGDDQGDLEISWAPILMAGPYLGVELSARGTDFTAHRSIYADVTGDGAWASPDDLFAPAAVERIAGLVRAAFNQPELATGEHPSADEAADLAESAMARARLHTDGLVLPVPGTEWALVLDQGSAGDLLTGAGREILDAAVSGAEYAGIRAPEPPPSAPGQLDFPTSVDCAQASCVALTFDDGPGAYTSGLLDLLAEQEAPATFFVLGEQARERPGVVRRMAEEGHVVGNHTWGHPDLATLTRKEIEQQFVTAADEIEKAGAPRPVLVRPPYGSFSDDVREAITDAGDAAVLWDVDTLDWQTRDTDKTIQAAVEGAGPGGIILMHDIHEPTVAAVGTIIDELRAAGYTLVTVPDLFGGTMDEGGVYRHGG